MSNRNNVTCYYELPTPKQELFLEQFEWWMETIGHFGVGCFGILLNCMTIFVLARPNMRKSFFNRLLVTLAVFDCVYLMCEVTEAFRHRYKTMLQQHLFVNIIYPVRNIVMCSSIYMTVTLAYERYQALKDPTTYRMRSMQNIGKRLRRYVSLILIVNAIFYAPKFNDLKVEESTDCIPKNITNATALKIQNKLFNVYQDLVYNIMNNISIKDSDALKDGRDLANEHCITEYHLSATTQRVHYLYVLLYINVANFIFTFIIPLVLLLYLNYNVVIAYKQFKGRQPSNIVNNNHRTDGNMIRVRRSNEIKKTKILASIVILYVICHALRVAMNINEFVAMMKRGIKDIEDYEEALNNGRCGGPIWTRYGKHISQFLLIVNATMNFFIYILCDNSLKQELRQMPIIKIPLQTFRHACSYFQSPIRNRTNTTNIEMENMAERVV